MAGIRIGEQWSSEHHRSGWRYALAALGPLDTADGVRLVGAAEHAFIWTPPHLRRVIAEPWIGFVHNPPFVPRVFRRRHAPAAMLRGEHWQASMPHCLGLFALSESLRDWYAPRVGCPVEALLHPTETRVPRYRDGGERVLLHVGWWLRNLRSFLALDAPGYRKRLLVPGDPPGRSAFRRQMRWRRYPDDVEQVAALSDDAYDEALATSVVFLDLFDSSANNTIVECIVRATPILVNRLPAVEEYLGRDYPLLYDSPREATRLLASDGAVREAHAALRERDTRAFTGRAFRAGFRRSAIYRSLAGAALTETR